MWENGRGGERFIKSGMLRTYLPNKSQVLPRGTDVLDCILLDAKLQRNTSVKCEAKVWFYGGLLGSIRLSHVTVTCIPPSTASTICRLKPSKVL